MKKFLTLFLSLTIFSLPTFGIFADEFAEASLDRNLGIKKYTPRIITDEFAETNTGKNAEMNKISIFEEVLPSLQKQRAIKQCKIEDFIFKKDLSPDVQIKIKQKLSTEKRPQEGSSVEFLTVKEAKYNDKTFPVGTTVTARVETVSMNARWGTPADIVLGNFYIDNIPLHGEINRTGANRIVWLRPLSITACAFGGAGFFLMFIRGGHAKIKPNEVFTVYF